MKRAMILIFLFLFSYISEAKPQPASVEISFGFFYSSLRNYGEWIELDANIYAWRPTIRERNWRPYSLGRWSWTTYGWYWDSYESFGWATYHYGKWFNDDYYGWLWLPDYEWGPAWVEWRYDNDYIGWAPLPPYSEFRISIGIYFSRNWHSNYHFWNFVPFKRFCDRRINDYIIDQRKSLYIFEHTRYRTNYFYERDRIVNGGIDRLFIEKRGGYRIEKRDVRHFDDFGNYEKSRGKNENNIYSYKPSDREFNNRGNEKYDIRRGENRTSLDINDINRMRNNSFPDRSKMQDENRTDNDERKTEREIDRNKPYNKNIDDKTYNPDRNSYEEKNRSETRRNQTNENYNRKDQSYQQEDKKVNAERDVSRKSERRNTQEEKRSSGRRR